MNGAAMDQASAAQHAHMMAAAHLQGGHLMPTPPPPGTAAGAAAASAQQAAQAAAAQQQLLSHAGGVTIVIFVICNKVTIALKVFDSPASILEYIRGQRCTEHHLKLQGILEKKKYLKKWSGV